MSNEIQENPILQQYNLKWDLPSNTTFHDSILLFFLVALLILVVSSEGMCQSWGSTGS